MRADGTRVEAMPPFVGTLLVAVLVVAAVASAMDAMRSIGSPNEARQAIGELRFILLRKISDLISSGQITRVIEYADFEEKLVRAVDVGATRQEMTVVERFLGDGRLATFKLIYEPATGPEEP